MRTLGSQVLPGRNSTCVTRSLRTTKRAEKTEGSSIDTRPWCGCLTCNHKDADRNEPVHVHVKSWVNIAQNNLSIRSMGAFTMLLHAHNRNSEVQQGLVSMIECAMSEALHLLRARDRPRICTRKVVMGKFRRHCLLCFHGLVILSAILACTPRHRLAE